MKLSNGKETIAESDSHFIMTRSYDCTGEVDQIPLSPLFATEDESRVHLPGPSPCKAAPGRLERSCRQQQTMQNDTWKSLGSAQLILKIFNSPVLELEIFR